VTPTTPPGTGEMIRRRPLARTVSPARWSEYDRLLRCAREHEWTIMDLESWLEGGGIQGQVLIVRHDVDQNPAAALRMARLDARYEVSGVWYFRWRTASPAAIERIRHLGGRIGLHYETLTRLVLGRGLDGHAVDEPLVAAAREQLRGEITAFAQRFGPIGSISAHGDTRVPGVSNQLLLAAEDASVFGVRFDANQALSRHRLGRWMTDRSRPDGGWEHGLDAEAVLGAREGPILCLTHPNNWCSGAALWSDRVRARVLPTPPLDAGEWRVGTRTRNDRPPGDAPPGRPPTGIVATPRLRTAAPVSVFSPVEQTLRREILRYYYDTGRSLVSRDGLRTLETNSGLAETRAATLEEMLATAGLESLRERPVLDVGCGFGALSLVFASRGARVTALDPNGERLAVGARVAAEHGFDVEWHVAEMGTAPLPAGPYDVIVMNNSLCYVMARRARRRALTDARAALTGGGLIVIRDPNRLRPLDPFTGLPLLALLPPRAAGAVSRLLRRPRSRVRLLSAPAARRELRRAGFVDVRSHVPGHHLPVPPLFAGYQHLSARRGQA
jgi:2-polyprenyl-3-methyl-5-hydroxy-6-metoxy-1,4-benzoquinol methylase